MSNTELSVGYWSFSDATSKQHHSHNWTIYRTSTGPHLQVVSSIGQNINSPFHLRVRTHLAFHTTCSANACRIQWNCRFNLFRFYFKKSWKDTITFLHDPHLSYPWSYGPNGYSMNYHCALSHILVIKFMVWNMKDQTAKCHSWFVSISCQASVWLEEGLRFLSGSCPTYTHNFSYFLSWKSLHIRRNFV